MAIGSGGGPAGGAGPESFERRGSQRRGLLRRGMQRRGSGRRTGETLRPVRTFLPRRGALLRTALVAILLAMAAGLLWLPDPGRPPGAATTTPAPGSPPGGAPAGVDAGVDLLPGGNATPVTDPPYGATPSYGSAPSYGSDPSAPAPPAGTVGVPVRMAEPAVLAVVRPGARVDLMLVPAPESGPPSAPNLLASAALVLDVLDPGRVDGAGALYLALAPEQARRVALAPPDARFVALIRS